MKKAIFGVVMLLFMVTATSCVQEAPIKDLKVSVLKLSVENESETTIDIVSGSGSYFVSSVNADIATATLSGTTVVVKGISEGETSVEITDKVTNQKAVVKVSVIKLVARITFTTTKAIGEDFYIGLLATTDIWIDLNNDGIQDTGEVLPKEPYEYVHDPYIDPDGLSNFYQYKCTLSSQTVSIYGEIKYINFLNDKDGSNLPLTSLDAKKSNLRIVLCENSGLSSLITDGMPSLRILNCSKNKLTSLDLSKLKELVDLECSYNELTVLDARNSIHMRYLYCNNNKLSSLSVAPTTEQSDICFYLSIINCSENKIKGDVAKKLVSDLPAGLRAIPRGLNQGKKLTRRLIFSINSATEQNEISLSDVDVLVKDKYWSISKKGGGSGPPQMDVDDWERDVFPCGYVGK